MHALAGRLAGLRVARDDHFVVEALDHHLVLVAFLVGVADRILGEGAGGDQALLGAGDGHALNNQGGRLASDAGLSLSSASLDNSQAGAISGKGAVEIRTGNLNNSRKASIGSDAGLTLVAARVDNSQAGRIARAMTPRALLRAPSSRTWARLAWDSAVCACRRSERAAAPARYLASAASRFCAASSATCREAARLRWAARAS